MASLDWLNASFFFYLLVAVATAIFLFPFSLDWLNASFFFYLL